MNLSKHRLKVCKRIRWLSRQLVGFSMTERETCHQVLRSKNLYKQVIIPQSLIIDVQGSPYFREHTQQTRSGHYEQSTLSSTQPIQLASVEGPNGQPTPVGLVPEKRGQRHLITFWLSSP